MKIKISDKVICMPPYLSTTWDKVSFLQSIKDPESNRFTLVIHLLDESVVRIEGLDASVIDIAFTAHVQYLERYGSKKEEFAAKNNPLLGLFNLPIEQTPLRFNLGKLPGSEGVDSFQHNPALSNSPPLPAEVLEKIAKIVEILSGGELGNLAKPESHCNCFHCQISRAIHGEEGLESEESISEEDLRFKNWEISELNDKLYLVKNPIDPKEQYSVFLGTPLGCTCGEESCEHIRAVLAT